MLKLPHVFSCSQTDQDLVEMIITHLGTRTGGHHRGMIVNLAGRSPIEKREVIEGLVEMTIIGKSQSPPEILCKVVISFTWWSFPP